MELKVEVVEQVPILEATEQNKALFNVIAGEASRLDIPVVEQFRAGASDANTIAEAGTPVVDGLGPVGKTRPQRPGISRSGESLHAERPVRLIPARRLATVRGGDSFSINSPPLAPSCLPQQVGEG